MTHLFEEAKRLYDLGFAIHWLHARSKLPVDDAWSTGPRKSWSELKKQYHIGLNAGVRLGNPTKVVRGGETLFLAVIDGDCKSADPRHMEEMNTKIKEAFGDVVDTAPCVMSGRGNGSTHIYVLTRFPVGGKRITQSSERVRVSMPSAKKPSAIEKAELTETELALGVRLRAAWEVSIMGDTQQVVIPLSEHPDTKALYTWLRPLQSIDSLPILEVSKSWTAAKRKKLKGADGKKFAVVDVVMTDPRFDGGLAELLTTGLGGTGDRSVDLFNAAKDMVRAGFNDQEILSVLTDRGLYLGQTAYDHAGTEDRAKAAEWVWRYTLEKARWEADASLAFSSELIEEPPLSDEEAERQRLDILEDLGEGEGNWQAKIERYGKQGGFKPKNTMDNVKLILCNAFEPGTFRENLFACKNIYGLSTPWGGTKGRELNDDDILLIKEWLIDNYKLEPSNDRIYEAVKLTAGKSSFHPVRDYLDSLKWDGVERISTWLKDYMSADMPDSPEYLAAVSTKVLVGLVARAYEPGIKFDHVLILQGGQGIGKSTSLRALVGDKWFSDAHIDIGNKDTVQSIGGKWLVEFGELRSFQHAETPLLKEFITRQTDRIRVPYGREPKDFPRQCVFIGTTNSREFLKDTTGNRRFWPVSVGKCDVEGIERDRDQLFAEAKFHYFDLGEKLYLDDPKTERQSIKEQEARGEYDVWLEEIPAFFDAENLKPEKERCINPQRFQMHELFRIVLTDDKDDKRNQMRLADILHRLGYERKQMRIEGQRRRWFYEKSKGEKSV